MPPVRRGPRRCWLAPQSDDDRRRRVTGAIGRDSAGANRRPQRSRPLMRVRLWEREDWHAQQHQNGPHAPSSLQRSTLRGPAGCVFKKSQTAVTPLRAANNQSSTVTLTLGSSFRLELKKTGKTKLGAYVVALKPKGVIYLLYYAIDCVNIKKYIFFFHPRLLALHSKTEDSTICF